MTTTTTPAGLIEGLRFEDYLTLEALSKSGIKTILPPGSPALYRWQRDHPVHKEIFDFGSAAHKAILRDETRLVHLIDAADWRTNAAKAARDKARAEGLIPLLKKDWPAIEAMATEVLTHPVASALLNAGFGRPEQTLLWTDPRRGIACKARLDYLPTTSSGRLIIPDYKTAECAEESAFAKTAADYGYHCQSPWYMDGAAAVLGLDPDEIAFVFIVQEKKAPYLVNVIELDDEATRLGRHLNDYAAGIYADCLRTDQWPGYGDDVKLASLPHWVTNPWKDLI